MFATEEQYKEVLTQIQKFCQENSKILGNPLYIPLFGRMINNWTGHNDRYALREEKGEMVFYCSDFLGGNEKKSFKITLENFASLLYGSGIINKSITPQKINENFLEGVRRYVREDQIGQSNIEGLVNLRLFHIGQNLMNSKQL
jgi:hypothetical protein